MITKCDSDKSFVKGIRAGKFSVKICRADENHYCVCRIKSFFWIPYSKKKFILDNYEDAEDFFLDLKFEMQKIM